MENAVKQVQTCPSLDPIFYDILYKNKGNIRSADWARIHQELATLTSEIVS